VTPRDVHQRGVGAGLEPAHREVFDVGVRVAVVGVAGDAQERLAEERLGHVDAVKDVQRV
jgi:hypothetical protein